MNRHLLADLIERGLWSPELKTKLIAHSKLADHRNDSKTRYVKLKTA